MCNLTQPTPNQAKQLQDELTDVLRSSAAANSNGSSSTHVEADTIGVSPAPAITSDVNVNFMTGKAVDTVKTTTMTMTMTMSTSTDMPTSVSTTAVTGSSRTNSVASEGLGSIEILHEEGLNSDAGGGGAYLEVSEVPNKQNGTAPRYSRLLSTLPVKAKG